MSDEAKLTPAERELETVLRSLRPTPAKIDPEAAVLAAVLRTAPRRMRLWRVAAAAAAIVVGGGAWLMLGPRGQISDRVERHAPVVKSDPAGAIELPFEPPTLLVYRRALAQSPAEFDALLAGQATIGATPDNQITPVGVLTLWNADIPTSLGEM